MKNNMAVRLTESAVMLAFAIVLSLVKVIDMPYGGSVTLCSMLPIVLIAYRYDVKWGLLVGLAGSLVQFLFGMNNLAYATSATAAVAIVLLDYIVAFTVLGFGGVFRKVIRNQATGLALGALMCCAMRYLCHVISGCTVWAGVSIPTSDGLMYSLIYNAAYMVPETIVTVAGALAIGGALDFRGERLRRLPHNRSGLIPAIASAVSIVAVAAVAVLLFASVQTEDGFDITAISGANWAIVALLGGVALAAAAVAGIVSARQKTTA